LKKKADGCVLFLILVVYRLCKVSVHFINVSKRLYVTTLQKHAPQTLFFWVVVGIYSDITKSKDMTKSG